MNSRGATLLDEKPVDEHVFLKPQIGALQGWLEEAARRRPAAAALLIDMKIADALVVAGVEIRNFSNPHLLGRIADGIENGPRKSRGLDAPAATNTMVLAFAEEVIL
jgi:hypothetical protein